MSRQTFTAFDFSHVRLLPKPCVLQSRSHADTSIKFGPRCFRLPVVPANMSTIIDENLARWLAARSYFYVMHRFDFNAVAFTRAMNEDNLYASISLGVQGSDFTTVEKLVDSPPAYVTIDVAHGDADAVLRMIEHVKKLLPSAFIIAGNVATPQAVERLENAGAGAIKVGIGPGAACTTAPTTGFGTQGWQLAAVERCADAAKTALIVADGGVREYGDIAKAIVFGADMVMAGGMFAAHDESPGELIENEGERFKTFFGSASEHQKGEHRFVEGKQLLMPYRGPIEVTLREMREALQSSISYGGGRELLDLRSVDHVLLSCP